MTARLCSRCHTLLHREDEGSLVFCWNCGAPQVQLSEELREQLDRQIATQHTASLPLDSTSNPVTEPAALSNAIVWSGAIQSAGLAGALAAALDLLSLVLSPVGVLSFFWFLCAPIVVLGVYSSRFRQTRITPGFGALLGLLSALAMLLATVTLNTVSLVLKRFVFHSLASLDVQLATLYAQMHTRLLEQTGPASAPAIAMLAVPEFRMGLLLAGLSMLFLLYFAFSATAGAFAGYLRSRAR